MGKFCMPLVAAGADSDDIVFEEIEMIAGMGTMTFKACLLFHFRMFVLVIRGIAQELLFCVLVAIKTKQAHRCL